MERDNSLAHTSSMAAESNLGLQRTFLAYDRTLMAWIRTSTSLITFGFSVYKFFAYLVDGDETPVAHRLFGPREFALAMVGIGLIALAFAAVQYKNSLQLLERQFGERYRSQAWTLAAFISALGLCVLIVVLLRQ
jgi:inner membrane protein YidH